MSEVDLIVHLQIVQHTDLDKLLTHHVLWVRHWEATSPNSSRDGIKTSTFGQGTQLNLFQVTNVQWFSFQEFYVSLVALAFTHWNFSCLFSEVKELFLLVYFSISD